MTWYYLTNASLLPGTEYVSSLLCYLKRHSDIVTAVWYFVLQRLELKISGTVLLFALPFPLLGVYHVLR